MNAVHLISTSCWMRFLELCRLQENEPAPGSWFHNMRSMAQDIPVDDLMLVIATEEA